jgi:hypothetical protein
MALSFLDRVSKTFRRLARNDAGHMRVGEHGSGLEVVSGFPRVDYLDDLDFPNYLKEFKEVANDPQVAKELFSNTFPVIAADWSVEPASDDPRDVEIAEFCSANLLNQGGDTYGRDYWQKTPWKGRLRDILRFLQNGHSIFQVVLRRQGRFIVYDKLKYLNPESVERWHFDEIDNLEYLLRTYTDSKGEHRNLERVDAADLVIYTWDQEGSNILGKPLIRPMWKPYRMKVLLEKLEVVDKQKTGVGVPFFQLQEGYTPEDEKKAEDLVKSMRVGKFEKAYAVIKPGQDFGWKEGGTATKGVREIIAGKDSDISKVGGGLMQELQTGDLGGGAGVAGAKSAFESMLHTAIALTVIEQEQRRIVSLVDLNWNPRPVAYPTLKVSRIDPNEQTKNVPEFVDAVTSVRSAGLDVETENEIRRRYNFMEVDPDTVEREQQDQQDQQDQMDPEDPLNQETPDQKKTRRQRQKLQRVKDLERAAVDAERMRKSLEAFERDYFLAARAVLRDMRDSVVADIRAGALHPSKAEEIKVPFQQDLRERLLSVMRNVRDFGRETVGDELGRQMRRLGRQRLAAKLDTRRTAISFANKQSEVLVQLDVTGLVTRLQQQATQQYNLLLGQGLQPEQVADGLQSYFGSLSDRQIRDMGRNSTAVAFNLGRNVTIQELKDDLEPNAIRTEVLDENTCPPCERLHGFTTEINSPAYFAKSPPAYCDGQRRCRGFWLVFPKVATT